MQRQTIRSGHPAQGPAQGSGQTRASDSTVCRCIGVRIADTGSLIETSSQRILAAPAAASMALWASPAPTANSNGFATLASAAITPGRGGDMLAPQRDSTRRGWPLNGHRDRLAVITELPCMAELTASGTPPTRFWNYDASVRRGIAIGMRLATGRRFVNMPRIGRSGRSEQTLRKLTCTKGIPLLETLLEHLAAGDLPRGRFRRKAGIGCAACWSGVQMPGNRRTAGSRRANRSDQSVLPNHVFTEGIEFGMEAPTKQIGQSWGGGDPPGGSRPRRVTVRPVSGPISNRCSGACSRRAAIMPVLGLTSSAPQPVPEQSSTSTPELAPGAPTKYRNPASERKTL